MELSGVTLGRRSPEALASRRRRAEGTRPTYAHVGSTLGGDAPPGVHALDLGVDCDGSLADARAALRAWAPHAGIGAQIVPGRPPAVGATVLVVLAGGPFALLVPNRVVALVDEPQRFGFAYGTLPGHPEVGEEAFLAEVVGAGRLRLSVRAHSRPAGVARLAPPVVHAVQRAAARRYLDAWAAAVADRRGLSRRRDG